MYREGGDTHVITGRGMHVNIIILVVVVVVVVVITNTSNFSSSVQEFTEKCWLIVIVWVFYGACDTN